MMRCGRFASLGELFAGRCFRWAASASLATRSLLLPEMRRLMPGVDLRCREQPGPDPRSGASINATLATWCTKQTALTPAACREVFRALAESDSSERKAPLLEPTR